MLLLGLLAYELCSSRVFKSEREVDVIRSACYIAGEAHKEVT